MTDTSNWRSGTRATLLWKSGKQVKAPKSCGGSGADGSSSIEGGGGGGRSGGGGGGGGAASGTDSPSSGRGSPATGSNSPNLGKIKAAKDARRQRLYLEHPELAAVESRPYVKRPSSVTHANYSRIPFGPHQAGEPGASPVGGWGRGRGKPANL